MTVTLDEIYHRLYDAYGPQGWWPAERPFEVIVGEILVQNTSAIKKIKDPNHYTV